MGFDEMIAAVFIGNVLTAAFLWAASRASRYKEDKEIPWLVLGGLALPLAFVLLVIFAAGQAGLFQGA